MAAIDTSTSRIVDLVVEACALADRLEAGAAAGTDPAAGGEAVDLLLQLRAELLGLADVAVSRDAADAAWGTVTEIDEVLAHLGRPLRAAG